MHKKDDVLTFLIMFLTLRQIAFFALFLLSAEGMFNAICDLVLYLHLYVTYITYNTCFYFHRFY